MLQELLVSQIVPILKVANQIKQEREKELINGYYHVQDSEIASELSEDLDTIRCCLREMESRDLIKIEEIPTDQTLMIKDITPKGKLVIKGKITLSELIDNNN